MTPVAGVKSKRFLQPRIEFAGWKKTARGWTETRDRPTPCQVREGCVERKTDSQCRCLGLATKPLRHADIATAMPMRKKVRDCFGAMRGVPCLQRSYVF